MQQTPQKRQFSLGTPCDSTWGKIVQQEWWFLSNCRLYVSQESPPLPSIIVVDPLDKESGLACDPALVRAIAVLLLRDQRIVIAHRHAVDPVGHLELIIKANVWVFRRDVFADEQFQCQVRNADSVDRNRLNGYVP